MDTTKVVVFQAGNKKLVRKKIIEDITLEMCNSKKNYVDFLIENKISAARIVGYECVKNQIFEIQEYVRHQNIQHSISEYISLISCFHRVSRAYKDDLLQKSVLKDKVVVANTKLDCVLIGFKEKYFTYARETFQRACKNPEIREKIMVWHKKIYKEFCSSVDITECVIHNDLTSDNIVCGENLTLIDFDFAIKSTPYVDVADVLFDRNIRIEDYLKGIRDKEYINKAVKTYNNNSDMHFINLRTVKLMAAIKLFVFVMYIYSRNNQIEQNLCDYLIEIGKEVSV